MSNIKSNTKTILITGAAGKLGRQFTHHFLNGGHTVVAASRRANTLSALAETLKRTPGRFESVVADLETESGEALAQRLAQRGLLPHAIVNNAVDLANQELPPSGLPTRTQWRREFDLAVAAPFELVMALADIPSTPLAAVVNIASMYGIVARKPALYDDPARESPIHYGVAKAAMIHMTKELSVRLAPRIRVNSVSFGGVEGRVDAAFLTRYADLCPSGRMLREDEVAEPVAFLISDGATAITGHNLVVDGGWTVW